MVLTGVEDGKVFINDPDGPQRRVLGLADFNTKIVRNPPAGAVALMVYGFPNKSKLPAVSK